MIAQVIIYDINTKDLSDTPEGKDQRTKLYQAVRMALESRGCVFIENSVYRNDSDDLSNVYWAIESLKKIDEFVQRGERLHHFEVTKTTDLKSWLQPG